MSEKTYGPASYFPSIEKKYGKSIAEWRELILHSGMDGQVAGVRTGLLSFDQLDGLAGRHVVHCH